MVLVAFQRRHIPLIKMPTTRLTSLIYFASSCWPLLPFLLVCPCSRPGLVWSSSNRRRKEHSPNSRALQARPKLVQVRSGQVRGKLPEYSPIQILRVSAKSDNLLADNTSIPTYTRPHIWVIGVFSFSCQTPSTISSSSVSLVFLAFLLARPLSAATS